MAYGLLLIRFVFGPTMAANGAQKLLGWFGGPGLQGTAGMLGKLRFRLAEPMAVLVALAATVHWKNGSSPATAATSSTLCILAAAVGIVATGPGRFSLDRLIDWDGSSSGLWWALGVLGAAALTSLAMLMLGRRRLASEQRAELRRAA